MSDFASPCPECGARGREGQACREIYEGLLALEYEQPALFGAAHHLTVLCYNLQHPAQFTDEALTLMRAGLRDIIEQGLPAAAMRARMSGRYEGSRRVLRDAPRAPERRAWSMTVADIRTSSQPAYIEDIHAWARSILSDLSAPGSPHPPDNRRR